MIEERAHQVFEVAGGDFGGKLMVTRRTGRVVREALEGALEGLPRDGILYVDTRGVELMDYSFADEALGILASRSASGEYGDRHLVLVEEDRDLLENVEASLRQRSPEDPRAICNRNQSLELRCFWRSCSSTESTVAPRDGIGNRQRQS